MCQLRYMMPDVPSFNSKYTVSWYFQFIAPNHHDDGCWNPLYYPVWHAPFPDQPGRSNCMRISVGVAKPNGSKVRWDSDTALTTTANPHPVDQALLFHQDLYFDNDVLGSAINQGWMAFDVNLDIAKMR